MYKAPGRTTLRIMHRVRPAPFTGYWTIFEINLIVLCKFRHESCMDCKNCVRNSAECKSFRDYFGEPYRFYDSNFNE